MPRSPRIPRTDRNKRCEKPGLCEGKEGELIMRCNDAPVYLDYALPLSENTCIKAISEHQPTMHDPYKEQYVQISHKLDQTLADPYLAHSPANLDIRFASFERELKELIESPELATGDKGRYLYHIEARVLESYLEAFHFRAANGADVPLPRKIIEMTHHAMVDILDDFDGLYKDIVAQVALKRTEIEIPIFLLRTKNPDFFTYPTLFREDASLTRAFNHDSYQLADNGKTPIQVKNTNYRLNGSRKMGDVYDDNTVLAIHQDVVNLDFRDGETHVTIIEPRGLEIVDEEDEPYAAYDEQPQFIAWGAQSRRPEDDDDTSTEYIQKIGGYKRDGLVDALVREARGGKLSIDELNMLNGASHYLMASIREKRQRSL